MWTIAIITTLIFAYLIYSGESENSPAEHHSFSTGDNDHSYYYRDADPNQGRRHSDYNRGPIFSPDHRHIWDGEKWIRNDGGLVIGIVIGVLFCIGIAVLFFYVLSN